MNFNHVKDSELTKALESHIRSERKTTQIILWHINEIDCRKLHLRMGYSSMFEYLTKKFGYCESSAYRRLQSARLLKDIPEIGGKLENGNLNLSQVTQVACALKKEEKTSSKSESTSRAKLILKDIENKSKKETEKILAIEFNLPAISNEIVKLQKDGSTRLEFTFSSEEMQVLQKAKTLVSHQMQDSSWKHLILLMANKEIQSKLGKKQRIASAPSSSSSYQGFSIIKKSDKRKRRNISREMKNELFDKANFQCQYQDPSTQKRCEARHFLQVEHIWPLALGGADNQSNLRIFCSAHNQLAAVEMGIDLHF